MTDKGKKENLGIYLHLPFCMKKCDYCDFLSGVSTEKERSVYVERLLEEMEENKELSETYGVSTVFLGGGTPSILESLQIEKILLKLKDIFVWEEEVEVTIECNPGTVTREKLTAYKNMGINRLSFGLQSTNNKELKELGRIHTWEEFLGSYEEARNVGFQNINVDLMSALPNQTMDSWRKTLEKIITLNPEHISAYSLIIEEGTPFFEKNEKGDLKIPDEDVERQMYDETKEILEQAGYKRYEISNYAKEGRACAHNLSYWNRIDYKGFGIGAASLLQGKRYKNQTNLKTYLDGQFFYEEEETLTRKEELEEMMFLGLRKEEGVEWTEELEAVYGTILDKMEKEKLLERVGKQIKLTKRGVEVSNYVFTEFLLD